MIILFLTTLIPVYGAIRNTAPDDPAAGQNSTISEQIDVPPELFDQALLDILESIDRAIEIAEDVDPATAEQLREKRDELISEALSMDVDGVLRVTEDIDLLIQELLNEASVNDREEIIQDVMDIYNDLQVSTDALEQLQDADVDIADIVTPPREVSPPPVTPPPKADFQPPTLTNISSPAIGAGFLSILGYTALAGFIALLAYMAYTHRDVIEDEIQKLKGVKKVVRLPIRRHYSPEEFYYYFLEKASKKGFKKMHYEAPLEHVTRINIRELREAGLYIGKRFEDKRYGGKEIPREELFRLYEKVEEL